MYPYKSLETKELVIAVLRWFVLQLVSIVLTVLGVFVVPIALLFTPKTRNELPSWAWPFDNNDPTGDGINGYYKWKDHYNGSSFFRPHFTSFLPRYIWTAFRNPVNRFAYRIAGFTMTNAMNRILLSEKIKYQDEAQDLDLLTSPTSVLWKVGNNDRAGTRITIVRNGDKIYFELYSIYNYPFYKDKCLRVRLGYKIGTYRSVETGEDVQAVSVINPFASFRGIKSR